MNSSSKLQKAKKINNKVEKPKHNAKEKGSITTLYMKIRSPRKNRYTFLLLRNDIRDDRIKMSSRIKFLEEENSKKDKSIDELKKGWKFVWVKRERRYAKKEEGDSPIKYIIQDSDT